MPGWLAYVAIHLASTINNVSALPRSSDALSPHAHRGQSFEIEMHYNNNTRIMTDNLTSQESNALQHWSLYGQGGGPSKERVTADGWKTKPMLTPITSSWDQPVPASEIIKVINGFQPVEMEDKWFVYTEGPDTSGEAVTYFARSWTGYSMAEVKMQTLGGTSDGKAGARFTEIIWESSPERYRSQTEDGAKTMVKEVLKWCMGVSF